MSAAPTCLACQAPVSGAYCAACGQRTDTARLQLGPFLRAALANLLDVDRGYLYTFLGLLRRPGPLLRAYLGGDRVRLVHPIRYFTLALTLLLVAGELLGVDTPITFYERASLHLLELLGWGSLVPSLRFVFERLDVFFFLVVIAFYGALFVLSIRLTRHLPYNISEVLVFVLFTGGEVLYILLPFSLLGLLHLPGYLLFNALAVPAFFAYQAYAAVGFFAKRPGRAVGIVLSANARVLLALPLVITVPISLIELGLSRNDFEHAGTAAVVLLFFLSGAWALHRLVRAWQQRQAQMKRARLSAELERRLTHCDPAARPYLEAALRQVQAGQRPTALQALKTQRRGAS